MIRPIITLLSVMLLLLACKPERRENRPYFSGDHPVAVVDEDQIAINDLVAVSGDTLIAAMWEGGILKTIDGGKDWEEIETPLFKHLSVDQHQRVWAIDSWVGIHESSYSRIFFSDDYGATWQRFENDTEVFFPLEFVSEFNPLVQILTRSWEVWTYRGGLPNKQESWELVKKLTTDEIKFDISRSVREGNYQVTKDGSLEKRMQDGQWSEVMEIPEISLPFDILHDSNKVYIAAGGYGGYKALFVEVLNDTLQVSRDMNSVQASGVRKDSHGRIWTFGDGGIFLLDADTLRKMM